MHFSIYTPLMEFNPTLLMIVITLFVLYLILRKNFFEKIRNYTLARENEIKSSFDSAEETVKAANETLQKYEAKMSGAEAEKRDIIAMGKQRADAQAKSIIDEAKEEAARIKARAMEEIEQERQKAVLEMQKQIAALAIMAAEKILEKQINDREQDEIVDKIIEQAGAGKWQS